MRLYCSEHASQLEVGCRLSLWSLGHFPSLVPLLAWLSPKKQSKTRRFPGKSLQAVWSCFLDSSTGIIKEKLSAEASIWGREPPLRMTWALASIPLLHSCTGRRLGCVCVCLMYFDMCTPFLQARCAKNSDVWCWGSRDSEYAQWGIYPGSSQGG